MDTSEILEDLQEYRKVPVVDERALPSFRLLASQIDGQYLDVLRTGLKVFFVNYDPYKGLEDMTKDIKRGLLKISQLHNVHPLFTEEQNLHFRAIHDYTHYKAQSDFSLEGEYKTFLEQSRHCLASSVPALYTEVVLQAAHMKYFGAFPIQKLFIRRCT